MDRRECFQLAVAGAAGAKDSHPRGTVRGQNRPARPRGVSPVGHTAQLHLDLAGYNFGIQEGGIIRGVEAEIFTGCATYKDGYLWASDSPGWGIEVNEQLAAKYPFRDRPDHLDGGWREIRLEDGTIIKSW